MSYVVDVYPTEEEIVRNEGELICQLCGKRFSNISARRLHAVKTHRILSCESDRRIYEKVRDGRPRRYIYHCPVEPCRKKTLRFDGMRNLKQHYIRVHTRKTILCKCGSAFALRKDLLYHEKKRCLLRDRPKKPTKQSVALPDEYQHTSTSRTNSLRKSQNMETDRLHKETRSKLMEEMTGVTNQPFIQPVILVVPTENVAAAIDAIKRGFRSTNEAAVQVHPFNFDPPIEKATVAVGMDQPSCFDFCAQANSSGSSFFYQTTAVGAATANASSSTEQPMLEFAQSSTFCYDAQQPPEQELQYVYSDGLVSETQVRHRTTSTNGQYLDDVYSGTPHVVAPSAPMARTFGTMVDEKVFTSNVSCVRNAETSMDGPEFDLLRDIETQTPWNDVGLMTEFWSDMGNSP